VLEVHIHYSINHSTIYIQRGTIFQTNKTKCQSQIDWHGIDRWWSFYCSPS